jgi:flagellar hook-basal body complex protein FliE
MKGISSVESMSATLQGLGNQDFLSGNSSRSIQGGNGLENPGAPGSGGLRSGGTAGTEAGVGASGGAAGKNGTTFSDLLENMVKQVNDDQVQADRAVKELVAGRSKNIHETMLTLERADTSLKLMMQVRNKVLDAYKEIMRMQV